MNAYRLTTAHLSALQLNLSHERARLQNAKHHSERELRCAWVAQLEREIAAEMVFLGISPAPQVEDEDALLAELLS